MADKSNIEWTEATWNPVTGCDKISAGCKNCYAERLSRRLLAMGSYRYRNGFKVTLHEDTVEIPRRWKAPRTIFVNSMSDLFHDSIPLEFIKRIFITMRECPQHTFQILTKRSARLRELSPCIKWPDNVWMGVSVEDECALQRVEDLKHVPANIRFLSCEPLIGPLPGLDLKDINWVIVGGESGPNSREMDPSWVQQIYDACRLANVPFFFKQWGGVRKDLTGRTFKRKTYSEMPFAASSKFRT